MAPTKNPTTISMEITKAPATIEVNGYAVRAIRMASGLTVSRVAAGVGIDRSYLAHIENGTRSRMSPETFGHLCRALCVGDRRALLANPHGLVA